MFICNSRIINSMEINNNNIKILLSTIGINPSKELIEDIISYLNKNKLELNMKNLFNFIKINNKFASNKIYFVNQQIKNKDSFDENMKNIGYSKFTDDFLIKKFNEITINIKRSDNIDSILAYDKSNSIIEIPEDILNQVLSDISKCNN